VSDAEASSERPRTIDELLRENRILERRLRRLEGDIHQVEEFQDSNATLLSRLLRDLEEERAKSQRLLLNVLPQRIIDRLAAGETLIADGHDDVTVLFSDIVGFTTISAETPPAELVHELNGLFSGFDAICDATGVDKIKTVGDAYLAVGGLVGDGAAGEVAIADTALRMIEFAAGRDQGIGGGTAQRDWRIRIGVHAGPIVAGVVGSSKFAYDVWGDTVNIASRLETTSEPGRIHLSADLARRLEPAFVVERRGLVDLKGKGSSETHWLVGRRDAAS
jgi:Adenylate cyclase, family 3 (some proteins contain HAMP domain)